MYQWLRKRVIAPLKQLEEVSASFVESSRQTQDPSRIDYKRADIHTGDEMEVLSDALNAMFDDTRRYMTNLPSVTAEKEKIGAELNVATQIQADMLPRIFPAFPDRREFDLYAFMHPAREVGGDFYDFFLIDEDHLCMVIADVSGKGVPAALFMVIAKTLIKNQAMMGDDPADILGKVNEQLCEGNEAMLFVTVWISILTISTGKGIAANAGHEHPVIRRAGGSYELVVYRHSPAVAAMEGMRFRQHSFELHPGDRLFVYTDGVPEATNAENELFGNERMLDVLNSQPDRKLHAMLETMKREIDIFVGEAPQFDDITMLCLDYFGPDREQKAEDPEGLTACSDGLT
jgi:sigma-B regulation protein RsbU (phosphoserine phosphatase)